MQTLNLKTLILECIKEVIKEEFGDTGWMQTTNVREEEGVDQQTKPLGSFGSTEFFWGTDPNVVTAYNGTEMDLKITVKRRGNSYYIQLDK